MTNHLDVYPPACLLRTNSQIVFVDRQPPRRTANTFARVTRFRRTILTSRHTAPTDTVALLPAPRQRFIHKSTLSLLWLALALRLPQFETRSHFQCACQVGVVSSGIYRGVCGPQSEQVNFTIRFLLLSLLTCALLLLPGHSSSAVLVHTAWSP